MSNSNMIYPFVYCVMIVYTLVIFLWVIYGAVVAFHDYFWQDILLCRTEIHHGSIFGYLIALPNDAWHWWKLFKLLMTQNIKTTWMQVLINNGSVWRNLRGGDIFINNISLWGRLWGMSLFINNGSLWVNLMGESNFISNMIAGCWNKYSQLREIIFSKVHYLEFNVISNEQKLVYFTIGKN